MGFKSMMNKISYSIPIFCAILFLINPAKTGQTAAEDPNPRIQEIRIPGGQTITMILIPAGRYIMGTDSLSIAGSKSPWPAHTVEISRPFYISKNEITQAQYVAVRGIKNNHSMHKGPERSVEKVSWFDAQWFVRQLNRSNQGHFRLPTEAEWEYACRLSDRCNLENMRGNLSEWCEDRWVPSHPREPQIDPRNRGSFFQRIWPLTNRVVRGITGSANPSSIVYNRMFEQSVDFHYTIGFRIVREAGGAAE